MPIQIDLIDTACFGGRSVGIVRSRTQTMEFVFFCLFDTACLPRRLRRRRGESGESEGSII
jgi:hypothetical protein